MSVFSIYKKEEHFLRAKALLDSDAISDHIYACLELRFCIEAIVYQKLLHGIDSIPNSIIKTWQPNKAMKMLLDFDEFTSTDCKIEINLLNNGSHSVDDWLKLGEQKIPNIKWLNKSYNKLGNFLHLIEPSKIETGNQREIKNKVSLIVKQLEVYVSGNLLVLNNNIEINSCPICKDDFAFSPQKIKHGELIKCHNYKCGAFFTANVDSLRITFTYKTYDVPCPNCKALLEIPIEKVRKLEKFSCSKCHSEYIPKGTYEFASLSKKS